MGDNTNDLAPRATDARPFGLRLAVVLWSAAAAAWCLARLADPMGLDPVVGCVVAVLWIGMILVLRRGSAGMRNVLTALGVLGEVGVVMRLGSVFDDPANVLDVVVGLLVLGAIVAMYRPDATRYFRRR